MQAHTTMVNDLKDGMERTLRGAADLRGPVNRFQGAAHLMGGTKAF